PRRCAAGGGRPGPSWARSSNDSQPLRTAQEEPVMTLPIQELTSRQPGKENGMAEHPNARLIWRGYELLSAGDMDGFLELFADDVAWHVPGRCPLAGDYKGRQGVLGYFTTIAELSGGTYQIGDVRFVFA